MSIQFLRFSLAVAIPPHARVNQKCYPIWNKDRSDLKVVWKGKTYKQPFKGVSFNIQPTEQSSKCFADGCVERLFCTDSGAVGHYIARYAGGYNNDNSTLYATWLSNHLVNYEKMLVAEGQEGNSTFMGYTSYYAQGTLAVSGNTVYYYTFKANTPYCFPRLSSLVFASYSLGKSGNQLVTEEIKAFNVLGYTGSQSWFSFYSPIYPSGPDSVTVSVNEFINGHSWSIDALVNVVGGVALRGGLVHFTRNEMPSVTAASREVVTIAGFTCHASVTGSVRCSPVSDGRYTWSADGVTALDQYFAPLSDFFDLPSRPWLHQERETLFGNIAFAPLVGSGFGPIIAVREGAFYAVDIIQDGACDSGYRISLTRYVKNGTETSHLFSESRGCAAALTFPSASHDQPSYATTAVKCMGLWGSDVQCFVASDIQESEYLGPFTEKDFGCNSGYFNGSGCSPCPLGRKCEGGALGGMDNAVWICAIVAIAIVGIMVLAAFILKKKDF